jgi:hypothetical protein
MTSAEAWARLREVVKSIGPNEAKVRWEGHALLYGDARYEDGKREAQAEHPDCGKYCAWPAGEGRRGMSKCEYPYDDRWRTEHPSWVARLFRHFLCCIRLHDSVDIDWSDHDPAKGMNVCLRPWCGRQRRHSAYHKEKSPKEDRVIAFVEGYTEEEAKTMLGDDRYDID